MNEKNRTVEEITYDHGAENMSENIMQPAMGLIQNKLKEVKEKLQVTDKDKHNFREDQLMYRRFEILLGRAMWIWFVVITLVFFVFIYSYFIAKRFALIWFFVCGLIVWIFYTSIFLALMNKMSKLHRFEYETNRKWMFQFFVLTTIIISFDVIYFNPFKINNLYDNQTQ